MHGLFSSARTWEDFSRLIVADDELSNFDLLHFEYPSPKINLRAPRRIPNYNDISKSLQSFIEIDAQDYDRIILVSHSQGGLVVQRYLARTLENARGIDLAKIDRVILFACPNSGSQVAITLRKGLKLWNHPQERSLRPLDEFVTATHEAILNRVVHATENSATQWHIPFFVFAGESDNIVTPTSASGVFPRSQVRVIPGDHSTIIRPSSQDHRSFRALKFVLLKPQADSSPHSTQRGISAGSIIRENIEDSTVNQRAIASRTESETKLRWQRGDSSFEFTGSLESIMKIAKEIGGEARESD
ncbi:alpha/beta fold hydrolase [Streptomyces sp. NRRL S-146]|uniref:alpha/beta fold hydrolase n=1 Tax=Streptomyces sp. NRRL S-146 TaxID=1463884 RepID=UPI001F428AAD|nr:alpha/beta fold hydrolase [Streptomyces sp. NRRL S-146]